MAETRIEWRPARLTANSGEAGYVNGVYLFSYGWHKGGRPDPWYVETTLPGFKRDLHAESPEAAKAKCERILARHVDRLGAAFPPPAVEHAALCMGEGQPTCTCGASARRSPAPRD